MNNPNNTIPAGDSRHDQIVAVIRDDFRTGAAFETEPGEQPELAAYCADAVCGLEPFYLPDERPPVEVVEEVKT